MQSRLSVKTFRSTVGRFIADETGATAIEYGLIAGFVSVAIIGALGTISTSLTSIFDGISTALGNGAAKVPKT
ncbi:pilus assembly protein Flp/PilA [Chitinasiproducens palmae]|uniref:Pilus assembly protein Flp/PilA n=2 Tax=Chitinasiproducens palmae TaxID=1770053 RepID=A0A1H2PV81_9BURK|nr:pilus assembly protein Flp/PilA [Chitinasiproducens palmae]